ncbi:MAG: DUF3394 domain-containing protein, partial [SAR324 cluster bacterium]|nr:DUF3394 domain-containing protein [SAR324 cluster bacterium]
MSSSRPTKWKAPSRSRRKTSPEIYHPSGVKDSAVFWGRFRYPAVVAGVRCQRTPSSASFPWPSISFKSTPGMGRPTDNLGTGSPSAAPKTMGPASVVPYPLRMLAPGKSVSSWRHNFCEIGADPIRTGVQAFLYSMRTVALPFIFIFNTQLLLIGITSWWHLVLTVTSATLAMLVFAAATMGYFFARSRLYETAILLVVAFVLFRPGFVWDNFYPPLVVKDAGAIVLGKTHVNRVLLAFKNGFPFDHTDRVSHRLGVGSPFL